MADVLIERVKLCDYRSYERAECSLAPGTTVLYGANGSGKTNLLEAIGLACTGRSARTRDDRELVRAGAKMASVTMTTSAFGVTNKVSVTIAPGSRKEVRVNGAPVEQVQALEARPLVCLFIPDRLALIRGAPSGRRAHLDALVGAVWPSRRTDRGAYARALGQRNALLASIRAGRAGRHTLEAWNHELATHAITLRAGRMEATETLAPPLAQRAKELGLDGRLEVRYRARSAAEDAVAFLAELSEHTDRDLERGFSTYGPHRDDLVLRHEGRDLRKYGSQGQQRLALLALLFAERDVLTDTRGGFPLMLLDDVFSELDRTRRGLLLDELAGRGQSVITTTDLEHVAGFADPTLLSVQIPRDVISATLADEASERAA